MRGYENTKFGTWLPLQWVPNPHEGLWVWIMITLTRWHISFQIPMRGYEHLQSFLNHNSSSRSKSPWGVMRRFATPDKLVPAPFQIPMRGYETSTSKCSACCIYVPNPHEGLWGMKQSDLVNRNNCSKSPWGVMSNTGSWCIWCWGAFQIPMRGYEMSNWPFLTAECSSSKSPWGVMRSVSRPPCSSNVPVPNPHEGLWGSH